MITGDGVHVTFVFADVAFTTEAVEDVPLLLMRDISIGSALSGTQRAYKKFTDKQQSAGCRLLLAE